jgi:hypothetical protein
MLSANLSRTHAGFVEQRQVEIRERLVGFAYFDVGDCLFISPLPRTAGNDVTAGRVGRARSDCRMPLP